MFRQRTSSQKPGDELLANFRENFPGIRGTTGENTGPGLSQTAGAENPSLDLPQQSGQQAQQDHFHDQDPTPRASDPWRFTPSLLDPSSYAFHAFGNAVPGMYTPNSSGVATMFHSQAGDLHTPMMGMLQGGNTPLAMTVSADQTIQHGAHPTDMGGFQTLQPHQLHHFHPFMQMPPSQPQSFTPSNFVHQDTGYETMEPDGSPMDSDPSDEPMSNIAAALQAGHSGVLSTVQRLPSAAEKFRFHSTLNAPTAMIKHSDEIPITYLNKGQAYSLSITDTNATLPLPPGTKYRTFVRVSFEDEEQRLKPGVCWGLWKEGRGTNEAHQRGGKLQAVEYVEASQPADGDDKRTRIEVESSSFDGFCVTWTPGASGAPEANISVRFNFLSTDFSHSKGVKGIPVRLCAKTQLLSRDTTQGTEDIMTETCYGKVKLFRDHGAERKLANDVAHVKKSIEKLKQQVSQAESGVKDVNKRKRQSISSKNHVEPQRPGKVQKHKRTWSMSSAGSVAERPRLTAEEDLHFRLQTLQDMFTSTRPVSVLFLRGEDLDDPDLHPVSLPGEAPPSNPEPRNWQARSGHSSVKSSLVSPSPSSLSLASQASAIGSTGPWPNYDARTTESVTTVNKTDDAGTLSGWIEALGVDPTYRPPQDRKPKPIACFYILRDSPSEGDKRAYHRAIYLMQRTLKELNNQIAYKWNFDPSRIQRTLHVLQSGLEVEFDDDVIRELREGQDMRLQIEELDPQSPAPKQEWQPSFSTDGAPEGKDTVKSGGIVLRLAF